MSPEAALRRTIPLVTLTALVAAAALGWWFLVASEFAMRSMEGDGALMDLMWMMMAPGDPGKYYFATVVMWVTMMIAMMAPAVIPMAHIFARMNRRQVKGDVACFIAGYFVAWTLFSFVIAVIQWLAHQYGILRLPLLSVKPLLAGGILIAAGIYQFTPLKDACLARCRTPLGFFMSQWREGRGGALVMGTRHGFFCVGCCWLLMFIMFVGGAMSVLTMIALGIFILVERLLPDGPWATKVPGAVMIAWGSYLIINAG